MLGWSFNLFRIRGIQLAVHSSFLLLLGYVAYEGWAADGWEGLLWGVALLLTFFTCVVLHELGHSFTARHYGVGVPRILLMPIGGMAEFDSIPRRPRHELLITIAGPAVNFAIAAVLWLVVGLPATSSLSDYDYPATAMGFAHYLLYWNLLMGCFNLLPSFPMDGGRILRALLAMRLPYLRATFWAATVGKIVCAIGMGIGLLYPGHLMYVALFGFIFIVGELEYRAVQRREREEAYWRERMLRAYPLPPDPRPPVPSISEAD